MSTFELFSTVFATASLFISIFTAYKTLVARFDGDVTLKPEVTLTTINQKASIVICIAVSNVGTKYGQIDDIVVVLQKREKKVGILNWLFLPLLSKENYSIFKNYSMADFEPFSSILIPPASLISRYIVFTPATHDESSNESIFQSGDYSLKILFRSERNKNINIRKRITFTIDQSILDSWKSGKSVLIQTDERNQDREKLLADD